MLLLLSCTTICRAQQKLTKEQLREDANLLYSSILDVHPYMFTGISKEKFEKELEEKKGILKDSMTVFDFYKMFAPLVAKIEDGHTELYYPVNFAIQHGIEVFPYTFTINRTDTTLIIREGFEGAKLSSGSRILSINGVPDKELIVQASSMLSGEAYHFKMARLNLLFSPLLYFILPYDEFRVEYLHNGKKETATIQAEPISKYLEVLLAFSGRETPCSFNIDKDLETAILSINSFDIYDNEGKKEYRHFLDSLFREIAENRINNLVIDIRKNGGGQEGLVWDLFQYISPVSFQTKGTGINKVSETVKKKYNPLNPQTFVFT
jgi:hypothetical protein